MKRTMAQRDQIASIHEKLLESNFLRYIVFGDVIRRYTDTILRNQVSWLKTAALLFIITRGSKISPSKLARVMLRSNYSITKLIDGLERDELVERQRDDEDRRIFNIHVTAKGIAFIEDSLHLLEKGEDTVKCCLNDKECQQLSELTRKLRLYLIETMTGLKS